METYSINFLKPANMINVRLIKNLPAVAVSTPNTSVKRRTPKRSPFQFLRGEASQGSFIFSDKAIPVSYSNFPASYRLSKIDNRQNIDENLSSSKTFHTTNRYFQVAKA